jgi:GxxExxY protein
MSTDYEHSEVTEAIIGCAYAVHNGLGHGFLEKVYENALALELDQGGVPVEQQVPMEVRYRDEAVGQYVVDMVVEDKVIVEVKAVRALDGGHEAQLIN